MAMPVYNESMTVIEVLSRADSYCDLLLAVDDGSDDQTRHLLRAYSSAHPQLLTVSHRTNRGMSGAALTAFLILRDAYERGVLTLDDIVVMMDSDGQHDPADIPRLIAPVRDGIVDMVLGRRNFDNYPWIKRWGNWGLSRWASWWSGIHYADSECGFRAFHVKLLLDILPYFNASQYGLAQEIAVIAARRHWRVRNDVVVQVPRYRLGARASQGFNNAASAVRAWRRVRMGSWVAHPPLWSDLVMDAVDNVPSGYPPMLGDWGALEARGLH